MTTRPRRRGSALPDRNWRSRGSWPSLLFPRSEISTRISPMAGSQEIQQGPRVLIIAIAAGRSPLRPMPRLLRCRARHLPRISPRSSVGRRRSPSRPGLFPPTMPVKALRRRLPASRWGSSTRSPSRSSASPIRTPGGHCRSRRFSEGWNEAWVPSPSGSGARPGRVGSMPRTATLPAVVLHVRSGVQQPPEGQRLPRCLHALDAVEPPPGADHNIPFVLRNNAPTGLPILTRTGRRGDDGEPHGIRRYLVHAPRLAARDEGLLAHSRNGRGDPDRTSPSRGKPPWCRPSASGTTPPAVG